MKDHNRALRYTPAMPNISTIKSVRRRNSGKDSKDPEHIKGELYEQIEQLT